MAGIKNNRNVKKTVVLQEIWPVNSCSHVTLEKTGECCGVCLWFCLKTSCWWFIKNLRSGMSAFRLHGNSWENLLRCLIIFPWFFFFASSFLPHLRAGSSNLTEILCAQPHLLVNVYYCNISAQGAKDGLFILVVKKKKRNLRNCQRE